MDFQKEASRKSLRPLSLTGLVAVLVGLNWFNFGFYYLKQGWTYGPDIFNISPLALLTLAAWAGRDDSQSTKIAAIFAGFMFLADLLLSWLLWKGHEPASGAIVRTWLRLWLTGPALVYIAARCRLKLEPRLDDRSFGRLLIWLTLIPQGGIILLGAGRFPALNQTDWILSAAFHCMSLVFICPLWLAGKTHRAFNNILGAGFGATVFLALATQAILNQKPWHMNYKEAFWAVAVAVSASYWLLAMITAVGLASGLSNRIKVLKEFKSLPFGSRPARRSLWLAAASLVMAGLTLAGLYLLSRQYTAPPAFDGPWRTVYLGRLKLEVPAEGRNSWLSQNSIWRTDLTWPDGSGLRLRERAFRPEDPPETQFQSVYEDLLRNSDCRGEDLSELFGRPAWLMVGGPYYICSLILAWPEGWLQISPHGGEAGRFFLPDQKPEERLASFLARVEEFLPAYQWLDLDHPPSAGSYKTEYGLLESGPEVAFSITSSATFFNSQEPDGYNITTVVGEYRPLTAATLKRYKPELLAQEMAYAMEYVFFGRPLRQHRRPLTVAGQKGELMGMTILGWHTEWLPYETSITGQRHSLRFILKSNRTKRVAANYPVAWGIFEGILKRASWLDQPAD